MAKSKIATAYVQILPSAEGIQGKLSGLLGGEAEAAGREAGSSFGGSMIGKVKKLIATAGLGKALGSTLTAGGALQQSLGGVETLFKENAAQVIAAAKNAYATAGMDANAYMETVTGFSASLIASLGDDTAAAAKVADMALTDMSDNANKFGTDMESIKNAYSGFAKQNYTMLDNLKLGYGGTKTEMERLLADAEKLTGVKYDINNLADVYEAIHAVQEKLGVAGATAKEASTTFSGSFGAMKAAATNVLGSLALGEDLRPALDALGETAVVFIKDNLFPMLGKVLKGLPEIVSSAFSLAIQGANLIARNSDAIVQTGLDFVIETGKAIILAAPSLTDAALRLVVSLGDSLIHADWFTIAKDTINEIRSGLDLAAAEILGTDESIIRSTSDAIVSGLNKMFEGGTWMTQKIVEGLKNALPWIVETGGSLLGELLRSLLLGLPDLLRTGLELIGSLIAGILEGGFDLIIVTADIGTRAAEALKGIDWLQLGKDVVNGIIAGLVSMGGALWEAATNIARSALDAIKGFFEIRSPSRRVKREVGVQVPAALAESFHEGTDVVRKASVELAGAGNAALRDELTGALDSAFYTSGRATAAGSGDVVQLLHAILNAIVDGNLELVRAILAEHHIEMNEREFARLVKKVIA